MVVGRRVCFGGRRELRLIFGQSCRVSLRAFGLFQCRVHPALVSLKIEFPVLSLFDRFPQHLKTVLCPLCWSDEPLFHLAQVFCQVSFQVGVFRFDSSRSTQDVVWRLDGHMAMVIVTGPDDGDVQGLEFFIEAVLMGQNGYPRLSPCSGGFNDLPMSVENRLGRDHLQHTLLNRRSASSKSLRRTEICCSSALRFMYLPKCLWTLCMMDYPSEGPGPHSGRGGPLARASVKSVGILHGLCCRLSFPDSGASLVGAGGVGLDRRRYG